MDHVSTLDEKSKTELDRILAMESAALTAADREFLKARRSYLTLPQQEAYGVSDEADSNESEASKEEEASEDPKPRKGKKVSKEEAV